MEDRLGMLLTTEEAAERLRVDPATVRRWRLDDVGPHYVKVGSIGEPEPGQRQGWQQPTDGRLPLEAPDMVGTARMDYAPHGLRGLPG